MNLIIDQGNTAVKYAVFNDNRCVEQGVFEEKDCTEVFERIQENYFIDKCMYVSVVKDSRVRELLRQKGILFELDENTKLPFTNSYRTPKTLGKDRIAAVAGALAESVDAPLLVIDAGTAITYDFLDREFCYLGGAISPGANMRAKAMNSFTSQLPTVTISSDVPLIGRNTTECLQAGIFHGIVNEMDGTINAYLANYPETQVYLTGGDALLFAKKLKNTIFAHPNLVLTGLNFLLEYNAQKI